MKWKIIITISLLIFSSMPGYSQFDYGFDFTKAGTAGLQFLKIGVGAKESAMGEAALGDTRGANAIFWNPAGIAAVSGKEVTFSQVGWLLGVDISAMAIALNIKNYLVFGISAIYLGLPEFEETTVLAQDGTGRMVSASDFAIGLAVAKNFTDKLAMGGQIRYVREQLDQDAFDNVLVDIGARYFTGYRHLNLSVCAQHFGPDIRMLRDRFRMPLIFKIGMADDLFYTESHKLMLAIDLLHPTDNIERVNCGLEYGLFQKAFIRAGYRINSDIGDWSFGVGLRQKLIGVDGAIDYGYSDYGEILGGVNRITMSLQF
ncbi:MAG: PorV/PorQ family protein [bacterium]|nr:PorV/PorQ family protein [bacterium]